MKRPWNLIDVPVYSMATCNEGRLNMNICTYVTPVSMQPKVYAVAVYHGTQTFFNLEKNESFVLQLLSSEQIGLVRSLGKRSGKDYNKEQYLFKKDVLMPWKGFHVLKQSTASMLMHIKERVVAGDHDVLICQVQAHRVAPEFDVLTLNKLRSKKLIRI